MKKETIKKLLPVEKKRKLMIGSKVTAEQKKHITEKADKAGMTVSDFVLACCYGYKLLNRLSEEECKLLKNLDHCRADMINFTSALRAMDHTRRKEMFNQYDFMLKWLKILASQSKSLDQFLEHVQRKNKVPEGTTN